MWYLPAEAENFMIKTFSVKPPQKTTGNYLKIDEPNEEHLCCIELYNCFHLLLSLCATLSCIMAPNGCDLPSLHSKKKCCFSWKWLLVLIENLQPRFSTFIFSQSVTLQSQLPRTLKMPHGDWSMNIWRQFFFCKLKRTQIYFNWMFYCVSGDLSSSLVALLV